MNGHVRCCHEHQWKRLQPSSSSESKRDSDSSEIRDEADIDDSDLLGTVCNQEKLWRESLENNLVTESYSQGGGQTHTESNPKMMQVLLSRLVTNAPQLLGNVTTNLAKCWMHIRTRFGGGEVINHSQSASWEYHCLGAECKQLELGL